MLINIEHKKTKHALDSFFLVENQHVLDFENTRKLSFFKYIFIKTNFGEKNNNNYQTYPKVFFFLKFQNLIKIIFNNILQEAKHGCIYNLIKNYM